MKKIQKSSVHKICDEVYYTDSRDLSARVKMFCPVCKFSISTFFDVESYKEYNCCDTCRVKFAESRREKWKEGWRPSKKDIEDFVKVLRSQPPSFVFK